MEPRDPAPGRAHSSLKSSVEFIGMLVRTQMANRSLVLIVDHPPINALSIAKGLVEDLTHRIRAAITDAEVDHIVIAGHGRMFSGGADLADFDRDPQQIDKIRALNDLVAASPKPVIAAIHGVALGGGLELALAAHYRVAITGSLLGTPEIKLGLLPGGGGTQRLTRLVGADRALQMMLGGEAVDAAEALRWGLVDEVAEGDPIAAALHFVDARPDLGAADRAVPPETTGSAPKPSTAGGSHREAAAAITRCVEAAVAGGPDGFALEAQLFHALMVSDTSRALRHAFLGERAVRRIPGLPSSAQASAIRMVGVVGGGVMGTGIATALLNAGRDVVLVEPDAVALDRAASSILKTLSRDVQKGRIEQAEADARMGRLTKAQSLSALAAVDLVIEAVFENLEVKREVFQALEAICRPDAILASNTSTLNLDTIAGFTAAPERVIGLHFFSPANVMRLLEVVRGAKTADAVLATAMQFAREIGKVGVVAGVCDGFIGNRLFEEYLRQAWFLLEEGALPAQIDQALEAWGMAMGPCRTMDLAGQDIGWSIRKRRAIEQPDRPYSRVPDLICERGWFGQKTGRGFYLYADGRNPTVDPEVEAIIVAHSAEIGLARRAIPDEEIVSRCVLALVNEGAHVVDEAIAYRPVDVDIVYLSGYGFPSSRGGPMFYADLIGLGRVLATVENYAQGRNGWAWTPAPLLVSLAARGGRFEELNR